MLNFVFDICMFLLLLEGIAAAGKCTKADMTLRYTECDRSGHRWLVGVPMSNASCELDPSVLEMVPRKARDCGDPCQPGFFLELESQNCQQCKPGTFSRGDSIDVEMWPSMPAGFFTTAEAPLNPDFNCSREQWKPRGEFLATTVRKCESRLMFSATLYKPGTLSFTYQMPDDELIFRLEVGNSECSSPAAASSSAGAAATGAKGGPVHHKYLDATGPGRWREITVALGSGHHTVLWLAAGFVSHRSVAKIRRLTVSNTEYSTHCTACPLGHFSSARASKCSPCPRDQFADRPGAAACVVCPTGTFSRPGSRGCSKRPACRTEDYTYSFSGCSSDNKRQKHYHWIEPQICSTDLPGSVRLLAKPGPEDCAPCPLGTQPANDSRACLFCPPGTASSSDGGCSACPANTRPVREIQFNRWSRTVPGLAFRCLHMDKNCKQEDTWILDGDRLRTSPSYDMNILQLDFEPSRGPSNSDAMTTLSVEFELHCSRLCILHLFLTHEKSATNRINTWVNSTKRHTFTFHIQRSSPGHLVWFFSRGELAAEEASQENPTQKNNDGLSIFAIRLSRVRSAGAVRCQFCDLKPGQSDNDECNDCGRAQFFSSVSHKCEPCPSGQILQRFPGLSEADCGPCGGGLTPTSDGALCVPDPAFVAPGGNNHYHLSGLTGSNLITGTKMFTTAGREYHHMFNLTLFVSAKIQPTMMSRCVSNFSRTEDSYEETEGGPICRMTIVASKTGNDSFIGLQVISLAEKFTDLRQSNLSMEFWKNMNDTLDKHGFGKDRIGMDLHIRMSSERKTDVCRQGRTTTVTLRCDLAEAAVQIMLPPRCPIGTCDGCNFHFLLRSRHACPRCRTESDLTRIDEECSAGQQTRHFQAASFCVPGPDFQKKIVISCPMFSLKLEIAGIVTVVILGTLLSLVIYCHKKNKKLEYKYSRLIGSSEAPNDNVLTSAETCGMQEGDEDEEDDVKVKTSSRSGKIFAKFNRPNRKRGNYDDSEKLNMDDDGGDFDI